MRRLVTRRVVTTSLPRLHGVMTRLTRVAVGDRGRGHWVALPLTRVTWDTGSSLWHVLVLRVSRWVGRLSLGIVERPARAAVGGVGSRARGSSSRGGGLGLIGYSRGVALSLVTLGVVVLTLLLLLLTVVIGVAGVRLGCGCLWHLVGGDVRWCRVWLHIGNSSPSRVVLRRGRLVRGRWRCRCGFRSGCTSRARCRSRG